MNCPVCLSPPVDGHSLQARDFLFEATDEIFRLYRCRGCDALFVDPLPSERELEAFYPLQYWRRRSPGFLGFLENRYRVLVSRDHISFVGKAAQSLYGTDRPTQLLDIGCGSGTLLGLLKRRGMTVQGFECSMEAAAIARVDHDVDVIVGSSIEAASLENGAFDLVTLFHVLEHVPDPRRLLAEVHRILRDGGRVVLQVPNTSSWQFKLWGARWYGLDVPRHVVNYSERSIRRLMSDAGFRICRASHFNLRDNAPALASTVFPSLDPISRAVRKSRHNKTESTVEAWLRHALYLVAVAASYPFAIAESLAGTGATIMIEAAKA